MFVDVQNLYYSARFIYNSRVNFGEVLKKAVDGRKLVRAFAYVIESDISKEQSFFDALELMGFEVRSKDLQVFYGGAKKGDWDVGIAMDCIELAPKLDVVIICSGDGDYIPLVRHLKYAMGCRVESMSFGKSTSSALVNEVDCYIDLDKNPVFRIGRSERDRPENPYKPSDPSYKPHQESVPGMVRPQHQRPLGPPVTTAPAPVSASQPVVLSAPVSRPPVVPPQQLPLKVMPKPFEPAKPPFFKGMDELKFESTKVEAKPEPRLEAKSESKPIARSPDRRKPTKKPVKKSR